MSSVQQIYNDLFAGKTVTIAVADKQQFESLRTALCKKNQIMYALDMTDGSIVGRFFASTNGHGHATAEFKLAVSQRKSRENRWTIVSSVENPPNEP